MKNSISRRAFLATSLGAAAALQAARALGAEDGAAVCALTPEQVLGPYFLDKAMLRSDITEGKPGWPLLLQLKIVEAKSCQPLAGAHVDVWQCDALGVYSGFTQAELGPPPGPPPGTEKGPPPGFDPRRGPPGGPPSPHTTDSLRFLRGAQLTGAGGLAVFQTIFPGCYQGRTNHIHFRVRAGDTSRAHVAHVGQVFFPEPFSLERMRGEPYAKSRVHRLTTGDDDIFQSQGGARTTASLTALEHGHRAELLAVLDPEATPAPAQMGPPRRR